MEGHLARFSFLGSGTDQEGDMVGVFCTVLDNKTIDKVMDWEDEWCITEKVMYDNFRGKEQL